MAGSASTAAAEGPAEGVNAGDSGISTPDLSLASLAGLDSAASGSGSSPPGRWGEDRAGYLGDADAWGCSRMRMARDEEDQRETVGVQRRRYTRGT